MMAFLDEVKAQLAKMSVAEKDEWILTRAMLVLEEQQADFWLSLTGEKKILGMPTLSEIKAFCERVDQGKIYVEYEKQYFEFDDNGRYMGSWKLWHVDVCAAMPFLDRVFAGCHDLLRLEEYELAADILGRVCELQFAVIKAQDCEEEPERAFFTLTEAEDEDLLLMSLGDVGADWIRAVMALMPEADSAQQARKLLDMLQHPVCLAVKPRLFVDWGISQAVFADMADMLAAEIAELEASMEVMYANRAFYRELFQMKEAADRKTEILLDIRVQCLEPEPSDAESEEMKLADCWEQIQENLRWLNYEQYIDDQLEIEMTQDLCAALLQTGKLQQEEWAIRQRVLKDIVRNDFYDLYYCGDIMGELANNLCAAPDEYLAYADMLNASGHYGAEAAELYRQYGREDKYVSYLEKHLQQGCQEYNDLINYYQSRDKQTEARRVAELGLEKCREDLTEIFICLLLDAQQNDDQQRFKKLLTSAKRRKHVDMERINDALGQ